MASAAGDTGESVGARRRLADLYIWPLSTALRKKRFRLIKSLILALPGPITIMDIGGTEAFWQQVGFTGRADIRIVLLNLTRVETNEPYLQSVVGDARDLSEYDDQQFDVVFSNSVIEHVGSYAQQRQMAEEVRRIGKRYCIQTPNRHFPVDPHFLLPFLQYYPMWLKVLATRYISIGSWGKVFDSKLAIEYFNKNHRLLTEREVRALFPGGRIHKERILGLTKSFLVYGGWDSAT